MRSVRPNLRACVLASLFGFSLVVLCGCGGSDPKPAESAATDSPPSLPADSAETEPPASQEESPAEPIRALTQAAIPPKPTEDSELDNVELPEVDFKKGTPQWLLREITVLRMRPLTPETAKEAGDAETPEAAEKVLAAQREARRKQNQEIIRLAEEAIALTHKSAEHAREFELAVHHLVEAHLQLALQGNQESIDALYDTSTLLYKRDPKSKAASEAAFRLTEFVQRSAVHFAAEEPRWLEEFARQAKLYATRFPEDPNRAAPLLFSAGRSCELNRQFKLAKSCFEMLKTDFPETPAAKESAAILHRLDLPGRPLQFAGPTIDGGFLSIDDFSGRHVLIVFWSSAAAPFQKLLPELQGVTEAIPQEKLEIIGVNLDTDEAAVDQFLEKHPIAWRQVFHPDVEKRGWQNPIVTYYGIRNVPLVWLVDPDGKVLSIDAQPKQLAAYFKQKFQ